LGGCLPETVQACHDACGVSLLILEKWMVGERSDDNLLLACQAALRTCRAECESAT
jgi:hypothetical protein